MVNQNATRHTLSVLVDNASGVLSQVSRLSPERATTLSPWPWAQPTTPKFPYHH